MKIEVVDDPSQLVAGHLQQAARAGGHVALSGSSTPRHAYELAGRGCDWSGATVWFVDERCVAPDSPDSNFLLVQKSLLAQLPPAQSPKVMRMRGELGAAAAAAEYETALHRQLGEKPKLDLVIMGIGPDGHTASLFPGKPALTETRRLVVGVPEAGFKPFVPRVTLTLPLLNDARKVLFLVTEANKAAIAARVFGSQRDPELPASRVQPHDGELLVVLDQQSAKELD